MSVKSSLPSAVRRQALTSGEPLVKGLALSFCARAWSGCPEVGGVVITGVGGAVMAGVGGGVMTGVGGGGRALVVKGGLDITASAELAELLLEPQAGPRSRSKQVTMKARMKRTKNLRLRQIPPTEARIRARIPTILILSVHHGC